MNSATVGSSDSEMNDTDCPAGVHNVWDREGIMCGFGVCVCVCVCVCEYLGLCVCVCVYKNM